MGDDEHFNIDGQRHDVIADLDTRAQEVRTTLLRIGGAIQVLEEELQKANKSHP